MPKYISGRYKKTPQSALTADRYRYLSPGDAEPNLGDPPTVQGTPNLPVGQQYIVVSFIDRPGERFWIPNQGGIIPGSLSVFEEGKLVGGLSSTTQLNFIGQSITAVGFGTGTNNPGVAVTITVAPPGNENEVLFVGAGGTDFATDTRFTFDDGLFTAGDRITVGTGGTVITTTGIGSVGIGTTNPTQKLHLDGNFRITGTIYDSLNQPGSQGDLIIKTATGGLEWVEQQSITAGAGGTIGQIQFHAATGLVDGANNFYYDYGNNRVGIGSTQPTQLLDVLGVSTFSGGVFVDTLNVSGITTFKNKVHFLDNDKLHFGGAEGDNGDLQIYHDASNSYIQDLGEGELILDGNGVILQYNSNSKLTTTAIGVTVTGITETQQLSVSGISSLANVVIDSNTIKTKPGTGNLIIDSDASVNIKDPLIVSGQTESGDKDSGSLVVEGGIGVEKSVNIGKNLKVTGITTLGSTNPNTGFTTTVGDLYVGGDLYINNDISFDNLQANTGTFKNSLEITGITTTHELYVGAAGTIGITTILDEDDMSSDSDTALATQQSIKAYVDNEIADVDLDFAGDSGTGSVGLGTQTFTISGTTNEIETSAENQTLTIGLPDDVTVSGNLTVNGNTVLGDDSTNDGDTVIFGSRISSNILPNANNTYDLGSTNRKWGTVYATTFNGDFVGTADNADSLTTARTFTLGEGEDDDIISIGKTFDGSADVGFALTLKDVGPGAGTYGGDNKLISLTLDNKGRVTGVTSTSIDFGNVNVATADSLTDSRTIEATGDIAWSVDFKGHENVSAAATLASIITQGSVGSSTQVGVVTFDTKGRITAASNVDINFTDATVGNANYADNAGIATNLAGGDAYQIPFQSAANTTQFITNGSVTGQILQYNEGSAPSWVSVGELSAGIAETANNLANGAAGSIPYQDGPGSTAFLAEPNTTGKILGYDNSTNAPVWINASSVGTDTFVGLTDTPADYTNQGGKIVAVNDDGDALVFIDASTAGTDTNTTYDLTGGGTNGSDFGAGTGTIILTDSNADTDTVTITAGTNIKIDGTSTTGFTISAQDTNTNDNTTYLLKATKDSDGGDTGTNTDPYLFLDASGSGTDDFVQLVGSGSVTVERNDDGKITISGTDIDTDINTTYTLPAGGTNGTNFTTDKGSATITLTGSDSTIDAVTITAGDNIKISGTSADGFTISAQDTNTDTQLSDEVVQDIVGNMFSGNTETGITATYKDDDGTIDLVVDAVTSSFIDLTDTPSEYTNSGGKLVAVKTDLTGTQKLEFIDALGSGIGTDNYVNSVSFSSGTLTLGRTGSLPDLTTTINLAGIGGTDTFLGLTDTPANYTNKSGKIVQVNDAGDGLKFTNPANLGITGTTYTLPASGDSNSVTLTLTGSDSTTDPVTITAGDGVSFSNITQSGFTITSTAVGGSEEPVGTIVAWGGSAENIPSEYKLCNGASLSRTEYADLFAALGTVHGSDSNSTFNIPDLRNQFIVGAKSGGNNNYPSLAVGATGGRADSILPQHNHDITDTGHHHDITAAKQSGGIETHDSGDGPRAVNSNLETSSNTTGITIDNVDNNETNATIISNQDTINVSNLPPYYALCFIIKTTASQSGSGTNPSGTGFVDKIEEGDTKAEVVDTETESTFIVDIDAARKFSVDSAGTRIHRQDNSLEGGSIVLNRAADDVAAFELDVYRSSSSDSDRFRIVDGIADVERLTIGSAGQIGLGGENYGLPGQVLTSNGSGSAPTWKNNGGGSSKIAILSDVKTAGTDGGDFDTGAWRNRELNTKLDPESFVTLNNNYFELGEGSYRISWSAPAHAVDKHQTRLTYANNTGFSNSSEVYGTSEACFDPILEGNNNIQTRSFGETIITITETTYFKIQHRCQDSKDISGFGLSQNFGGDGDNEAIYTQVIIQDLNSGGGSSSSGGSGGEPVGTIIAWGGSAATIPSGYQLCDGGVAATDALRDITGTNVPDLTSRFIVGVDNVNAIGTYPGVGVGSTGGSANAVLIAHNHTISPTTVLSSANGGTTILQGASSGTALNYGTTTGSDTVGQTNTGADSISQTGDNANLPPYYALCYIIKHTATASSGSSSGSSSGGSGFVLQTAKSAATENNNPIEFTDIPADAYEITVMFNGVTLSGGDDYLIQLGTSSGYIGTGYTSSSINESGTPTVNRNDGFIVYSTSANGVHHGKFDINKFSNTVYTFEGQTRRSLNTASQAYGTLNNVNGTITRLRIKPTGTNTFDAGSINISYKTAGSGSGSSIVLLDPKTATGSSVEFTGIPDDAQEITLMFEGVSGSTGRDFDVQLGTSSGYITSNYDSSSEKAEGTSNSISTSSFVIRNVNASHSFHGSMIINKSSSNSYVEIGQFKRASLSACETFGSLSSVSGVVDRLKVSIGDGNFNAGLIGLSYKTSGSGSSGSSGSSGNNQTWLADYQNVQSETGSSVEWTGIPQDTQRIIIMFHDASPGSGQDWLVQLGNTSGNYSAGVYDASSVTQIGGDSKRHSTEGFIINVSADSATPSGRMVIERSRQDNTRGWVATGQITHGTGGGMRQFAGSFASSTTVSVFDRIRFITENGGRCFDGGRISILCEGPGGGSGSGSGGGLSTLKVVEFTSSTTYTPSSGATNFIVYATGGGGGAGGGTATGGGGGGGTAIRAYNSVEMGSSAVITIGGGGSGGAADSNQWSLNNGGHGGNTTFNPGGTGTTITGGGGRRSTGTGGGAGGTATNGQSNLTGLGGASSQAISSGYDSTSTPSPGGPSHFQHRGHGGDGAIAFKVDAVDTIDYSATSGGSGTAGIVIVYEYG